MSFDVWMEKVDSLSYSRLGVSVHDLVDFDWHGHYDGGATPSEALADFCEWDGVDLAQPNNWLSIDW